MLEQNKDWNNISKRKKRKNQYNKKGNYNKNNSSIFKNVNKKSEIILSKHDFPSLTTNKLSHDVFSSSLVWVKEKNKLTFNNNNTIYTKAKNGLSLLSSYPNFNDSPEPPFFT